MKSFIASRINGSVYTKSWAFKRCSFRVRFRWLKTTKSRALREDFMKRIVFALIAMFVLVSFCGCERNVFRFAGKEAPKKAPAYTVTAEQSANK